MEGWRWYAEGLLHPVPVDVDRDGNAAWDDVVPQVHWLPQRSLDRPLLAAYLTHPLGGIVRSGPPDYASVLDRINRSIEVTVELVLSVENGRGVCKQAVIRPGSHGSNIAGVPKLPLEEFLHAIGWSKQMKVAPKPRGLARIAEEAARVYLASPKGPARAVALHFGWATEGLPWREDDAARARVHRAIKVAETLGHIPKAPAERKGGEPSPSPPGPRAWRHSRRRC